MESMEFPEGDVLSQIDLDTFFDDSPADLSLLGADDLAGSSPDCSPLSIYDIENFLMMDEGDAVAVESGKEVSDSFFADLFVDSPSDGSGEVVGGVSDKESDSSNCRTAAASDKQSGFAEAVDAPVCKKLQRQLRNRDAAVRSRERKKTYVKDLEMKSKYFERECLRLGRLLQCLTAENQALRFSLQNGNAYGASMAKQESAVLLLESLLLGSLFWFLGIMCLSTLPALLQLTLETGNAGKKDPGTRAPKGARSETHGSCGSVSMFIKSRRCKASKPKMKTELVIPDDASSLFRLASSITGF